MQLNPEPPASPAAEPSAETPPAPFPSPAPQPPSSPATQQIPPPSTPLPQQNPPISTPPEQNTSPRNIIIALVSIILVSVLIYSYINSNQHKSIAIVTTSPSTAIVTTSPTTSTSVPIVKPSLGFSTLINRSNVLFGIPNYSPSPCYYAAGLDNVMWHCFAFRISRHIL